MLKTYLRFSFLLAALLVIGCAKRGSITGGAKDTIAPVLQSSFPKNGSTGFTGKEIRITFNEYIKLKNLKKQLVISPPMKSDPIITPSNASKYINIRMLDTLQPNTTYSFNFGQSIEDNNEGNPYPQFKYIFSTGAYIDSLSLGGMIKDAREKNVESFVSVMLYEVNDTFNDSIIYKKPPRYVTNTLDSLKTFRLDNLKAGKYLLVAMKDYNSNNIFDPKNDKIAFHKEFVTVPNDTLYEMELFKETLPFKAIKPIPVSGNKMLMGYEGKPKNTKVTLRNGTEDIPVIATQFPKKDSLQLWFKPMKADSLQVAVNNGSYSHNFTLKLKEQKNDTISFRSKNNGPSPLTEKFTILSGTPLVRFDNSKISLVNKDSTAVPFTTSYDEWNQEFMVDFKKEPLEKYSLKLFPGALTDFMEKTNDTLKYSINTKNTSDYGNLRVTLHNVRKFPVIVELTNKKGEVLLSQYSDSATVIDFSNIEPALYTLRLIYDSNGNKEWDTGSYIEKRQTEEVIYFPAELEVRANWDVDENFRLP